jgi:crossover junction endodeoxyribonuclease RuvC
MRVIGIDPGTVHAGYGIVEEQGNGFVRIASGCVNAKGATVATRLALIFRGLQAAIEKFSPQAAAIETVFIGNNVKTALVIGEARAVAILAAALAGLEVASYEPTLVKRAITSSGKADKEQVLRMIKVWLNLQDLPPTDHEADALALAITHLRHATVEQRIAVGKPRRR